MNRHREINAASSQLFDDLLRKLALKVGGFFRLMINLTEMMRLARLKRLRFARRGVADRLVTVRRLRSGRMTGAMSCSPQKWRGVWPRSLLRHSWTLAGPPSQHSQYAIDWLRRPWRKNADQPLPQLSFYRLRCLPPLYGAYCRSSSYADS